MDSPWVWRPRAVRASRGRCHVASSKEAGIPVLPNQGDELLDRGDVGGRLVAVPLHILTQPENAPAAHRAYVGRLGNGKLDSLARGATARAPQLEDLDALTRYPIREVNLLTAVVWGTAAFHEGTYRPAHACTLELGERHSSQALPATAAKAAIPPPAGNRDKLLRRDGNRLGPPMP